MENDDASGNQPSAAFGDRTSRGRLAYLLCELSLRARGHEIGFELPLTLTALAVRLGLTPIHIHRTFHALQVEGFITSAGQTVTILDMDRLRSLAEFDPGGSDLHH